MKMKRFIAAGAHQAMEQVNDALGPDALILSNRKVAEGVEIIAAVDYEDELLSSTPASTESTPPGDEVSEGVAQDVTEDRAPVRTEDELDDAEKHSLECMHQEITALRSMLEVPLSRLVWSEMERRQPHRAAMLARMAELGMHPVIANRVADQLADIQDDEQGWKQSLSILESMLPVAEDELLDTGGVVALVGPTGVGKTTTIAKLAARFALRHGRRHVALVTMDHYRIGAHDQLRTYGKLIGVPVYIAGDEEELRVILNQMNDRKLILIDTAGTSQRSMQLAEKFAALNVDGAEIRRYLVLSATSQMTVNDEVISAFSGIKPEGCILTKIDEATSLGSSLSVLIRHKLPVSYMGDGQCVPDDFHPASARRLIAQAVALINENRDTQSDEAWMQIPDVAETGTNAHAC
ncbi:MAG: flagellar biosynthesis protein FlhF [Gammaproteobacteria bacterium]|nr:flagellar biosynthesis protein FlhF [Gammaproteobacteria bacterium]